MRLCEFHLSRWLVTNYQYTNLLKTGSHWSKKKKTLNKCLIHRQKKRRSIAEKKNCLIRAAHMRSTCASASIREQACIGSVSTTGHRCIARNTQDPRTCLTRPSHCPILRSQEQGFTLSCRSLGCAGKVAPPCRTTTAARLSVPRPGVTRSFWNPRASPSIQPARLFAMPHCLLRTPYLRATK